MRTFPSRWHSSAACKEAAKNRRRSSRATSHLKSLSAIVGSHAAATAEEEIKQNDTTPKNSFLKIPSSPGMALYSGRSVQSRSLDASTQAGGEFTIRKQASVDVYPFAPSDDREWELMDSSIDDGLVGRGRSVNSSATKSFLQFNNIAEKEKFILQNLSDTEIESGADFEGKHAAYKDSSGEISDGEEEASIFFCRKTMNARRMRGDFPPPLASLGSTKAREGCVQLQPIRSKGRFMLKEVKVAPRLPFLSIRTNGRLVLQLIHPREVVTRCCSADSNTSSENVVSEPVDNIRLDEVEAAALELCSMKDAAQALCESDRSLLDREETGETKGHCKKSPLDEALEYSKGAVQKIPGSEASLSDQQTATRYKYSDQGANWVFDPTNSPGTEGSIGAEHIISGDAVYLLNEKATTDTQLSGANLIIHHADSKDPCKRAKGIFMVHTTRAKIVNSGSSRRVAGNHEMKTYDSISSLPISKTNECACMASHYLSLNKGILAQ
ncbi:hypothetical protein O6H91_06G014100 [Diphasiastrum complanatum]|uniref:Uncharacterized protein n=2 Tax=Diphasiastrum complanatum TaxID=34168 RepID=A0ACC2DB49_DIPCM|nr:hypothetical protein O6H91_06G014100 [Diphasiastrum complanatum]KAJ7551410.1 hypothetical protein O6H91_06G014100 [Diphasiastrum complanatum]